MYCEWYSKVNETKCDTKRMDVALTVQREGKQGRINHKTQHANEEGVHEEVGSNQDIEGKETLIT